ncbi:MAG: hypothetical protein HY279_12650 [Nitrospinae bacterium]|nr:hypothetical protein [Nitrospinota bacterium]
MKRIVNFGIVLWLLMAQSALAKEIPYTLEDRDRLIKIETSLKEFKESIDKRFEQVDKRFDQIDKRFEQVDKRSDGIERRLERLETVMMWGFGLLFTSMMGLVGFVLWDRRTTVAPVVRSIKEKEEDIEDLKRKERALEDVLRDYAFGGKNLAEAMKARGLI